jgi:hypothetical protein
MTLIFLRNAKDAKIRTIMLSEFMIDATFIPIGDKPRNSPETPARLKLKATDSTNCSTRSSLPS